MLLEIVYIIYSYFIFLRCVLDLFDEYCDVLCMIILILCEFLFDFFNIFIYIFEKINVRFWLVI